MGTCEDAILLSTRRVNAQLSSLSPKILGNERVEGKQILAEIFTFCNAFIAYPRPEYVVPHTLWIAHTWFMDQWQTTPRLAFLSRDPGSGKSRALEVTAELVPNPIHAANVTPSYMLRKIGQGDSVTLLIDEADTIFTKGGGGNESLRGLLNAGYRKGAVIGKATTKGIEELQSYAPVAIAGLGNLPDTVMTRSVIIPMSKRREGQSIRPFRLAEISPIAQKIRGKMETWHPNFCYPELPEAIADRNADVWEPLLTVADAAGGDWPRVSRQVALKIIGS